MKIRHNQYSPSQLVYYKEVDAGDLVVYLIVWIFSLLYIRPKDWSGFWLLNIIFFFMALPRFIYYIQKKLNRPAVVINEKGVWLKRYGHIDWNNIIALERTVVYCYRFQKYSSWRRQEFALGIRLKYPQPICRKRWFGRARLMMRTGSKISDYHILLPFLDVDYEAVKKYYAQRVQKN